MITTVARDTSTTEQLKERAAKRPGTLPRPSSAMIERTSRIPFPSRRF
jgi:hypothetical protein